MKAIYLALTLLFSTVLDLTVGQAATCPEPPVCDEMDQLCVGFMPMPPKTPCGPPAPPPCPHHFCIPKTMNSTTGFECPRECPKHCGLNEKYCPGGYDHNGCEMHAFCLSKPTCGPEPECPPSKFDPEGCPVEPVCDYENEIFCPAHVPHGLPPKAPARCKPLGYCLPKFHTAVFDKNGDHCPSFCSSPCPPMTMHCPGHFDDNGCPRPHTCVPNTPHMECPGPEFNSRGCKTQDIPECTPENKLCPVGADENGCHLGFTMVPRNDHCPEVQLPPLN